MIRTMSKFNFVGISMFVSIVSVKRGKGRIGKQGCAKIGDMVKVAVKKGTPEMKGKVFDAVIIRQKRPWRRLSGERVMFEDNAVAILKDEKGHSHIK